MQETGCSKLQGYYYSKPVSFAEILARKQSGHPLAPENPEESGYYESIGCVNLYDLSVIANAEENAFHNTFSTLPMGIVEVQGDSSRFVRSNPSYREFIKRFFGLDLSLEGAVFKKYSTSFMNHVVKTCCERGNRAFYDEKMPDGSVVHSFARRIGVNPISGNQAVAIAVLSVSDPDEDVSYEEIVRALAANYYSIYVVDMETDRFMEYRSPSGEQEIAVERRGEDFFGAARSDAVTRVFEADRDAFQSIFSKERINRELDAQGVFMATCRLIDTGKPVYASIKITRMRPHGNRVIIGISIIEALMRQKEAAERAYEQGIVFGRMAALAGKYYALYIVDPETGKYAENNVTSGYENLGFDKAGDNFFTKARSDGEKAVYFEDLPFFLERFTKENILRGIREKGMFQIQYRLVINGTPRPIVLKAAKVRESDGEKIIVGVNIVDES